MSSLFSIMYVRLHEPYPSLVGVREILNRPEESVREPDIKDTDGKIIEKGSIIKEGRIDFFKRVAGVDPSVTRYPLLTRVLAEGAARYMSASKEVRDSIQTAVIQTRFLRDPAISQSPERRKEISFADLKRRKMTIFIIIPPRASAHARQVFKAARSLRPGELIREPAKPEKPVLFMLDELPSSGLWPLSKTRPLSFGIIKSGSGSSCKTSRN